MVGRKAVLMFVLLSLGLVAATYHPAQTELSATIDFSGLAEGAIVGSLSLGAGISGDPIEGSISVFGFNPDFPGDPPDEPPPNTAMIFDATCADGCSGGDDDLFWPELGNVLIISEDLITENPDDADNEGAYFFFDFTNFGPGKVDVESLIVGDVETDEGGVIKLVNSDGIEQTIEFEPTGDAEYEKVFVGELDAIVEDIVEMEVDLNGSGVIDNIELRVEEDISEPRITLQATCEPTGQYSEDLRLRGSLKRDGDRIPNHTITLTLPPNGEEISLQTDNNGNYSYLFAGARNYPDQVITAEATVDGRHDSASHTIREADFAACSDGIWITLQGTCEPKNQLSFDLRLTGVLKRDGNPIVNHPIELKLPDGNSFELETDQAGEISYLFIGAASYISKSVTATTQVDGQVYSATHTITEANFADCIRIPPPIPIQGTCEPTGKFSEDLRITGTLFLEREDGFILVPNHPLSLNLPDGQEISLSSDQNGEFSYLFVGAKNYIGQTVTVQATVNGEDINSSYTIAASDFDLCKSKSYQCNNVFLFTFHGQPIEPGSQIPGWGLVDTHIVCKGIGQGKSCRLVIKDQPGYVVKSDSLEMDVSRLEPYVRYQAQIKGYDGAWTNKGCEFSFITGGGVASISTHLADQVDSLGWVYLGEGRNAIKPLGACSGWNDACLFADNIIGFHLDDIYGNQLPGSEMAGMQPGDRISIYRDHRLHTYEFIGSERVRQSAEGNQTILDAAEQHDLVLTTCSGYKLIGAGNFSHTRYATFKLLPRIERLYQWQ